MKEKISDIIKLLLDEEVIPILVSLFFYQGCIK